MAAQPEQPAGSFVDSLAVAEPITEAPALASEDDGWVSNERSSFPTPVAPAPAPAAPAAPAPAFDAFATPPAVDAPMSSEILAGQVIDDLGSVEQSFSAPPPIPAMDQGFPAPAPTPAPAPGELGADAFAEVEGGDVRSSVMNFLRRD